MYEKTIKRYSAYFFGWCQAFGEHETDFVDNDDINWLYGEAKIGVVFAAKTRRRFLREMSRPEKLQIQFSYSGIQLKDFFYRMESAKDRAGMRRMVDFLRDCGETHLYLTNHLCYPPGTRILTFGARKPLSILYKEITPLTVQLLFE